MKRAAIYARVSTHNGQNPEMQIDEVREYCRRRGWKIVGEFVDEGISGSKEHRPALDSLLSDCRKRLVDAVVVYRYDRFARSLRQLVNALDEFRALGIDFVSLHEGVDTSTPNGRLVFGIFATIAEFERELIRDRVRSGLALARSRGGGNSGDRGSSWMLPEWQPCALRAAPGLLSQQNWASVEAPRNALVRACPKTSAKQPPQLPDLQGSQALQTNRPKTDDL